MRSPIRVVFACAFVAGILSPSALAEQVWKFTGGTASATFFTGVLKDQGLRLVNLRSTAKGTEMMSESVGFRIGSTSLRFKVSQTAFSGFVKGQVNAEGGFALASGNKSIDLSDFTITPRAVLPEEGLSVGAARGQASALQFTMEKPVVSFNANTGQLIVGMADLHLSAKSARELGRPDLGGMLVGMLHLEGDSVFESGDRDDAPPSQAEGDSAVLDVSLSALSSLSQMARFGSVVGLSMSTTSCNVGTQPILWYAPMDERHPVICMNLYRLHQGRFEMIGTAWLKHGFLSTNSNGCGTCQQPPQGGQALGLNCSDTYGTGNNSDRRYLGPREEVNPFLGTWECTGSWFSNFVPDCIRRNTGSGLNPVEHMLEVNDAELSATATTGAQYVYEAYYVTPDDVNKYNQIGWRLANASGSAGGTWTFANQTNLAQGTALQGVSWANATAIAQPRTEGDVIVGVRTTDLGGGVTRYDYAVYVHDMDRQIREFSVPVADNLTVSNIQFRDIDSNAANNWTGVRADGKVKWSTQTFGENPNANSLKWGRMFNFRFDANAAPVNNCVNFGLFKPGAMMLVSADLRGPSNTSRAVAESLAIVQGTQSGGNLASLGLSDGNALSVQCDENVPNAEIEITGTSPCPDPSVLKFNLRSSHTRADVSQSIRLWNYVTNAWEVVDTRPVTTSYSDVQIVINTNALRFVGPNSQVKARLLYAPINEVNGFDGWGPFIDVANWEITM